MNRNIKLGLILLTVLIAGLIVFRIAAKVSQSGKKPRTFTATVGTAPLRLETVDQILNFTGTVEGDPQVKVYASVNGKFWENAVREGSWVGRDDILAYINRDIVGMNYQLASVRSPVAGMVKKLYFADRGAAVTPDRPVAEVADPRGIKVILNAGQDDLSRIRSGMAGRISPVSDPSNSVDGAVASVTPFVDSDSLSGSIIVKARNPGGRLTLGSTVNVEIIVGRQAMFMVPQEAVLARLDRTYVFVNNDGIAREVVVVQGYARDDRVQISGALREGDEIVVQGAFKLSEGSRIQTAASAPTPPAGKKKPGKPPRKDKR
jgi:multidrug efflux pump subunit AcrA (membrane-fusion protein)